jgi:hypothetical protein
MKGGLPLLLVPVMAGRVCGSSPRHPAQAAIAVDARSGAVAGEKAQTEAWEGAALKAGEGSEEAALLLAVLLAAVGAVRTATGGNQAESGGAGAVTVQGVACTSDCLPMPPLPLSSGPGRDPAPGAAAQWARAAANAGLSLC